MLKNVNLSKNTKDFIDGGIMKKNYLANRSCIVYLFTIIACVTILSILYNFHEVDITKPIVYEGDSISASYLMKTIDDNGWYLENSYVGGAFGGDFYDYIMSDGISFGLVKIISIFTNNVYLIFNLFYFMTYILVSLTSLYVFLQLKIKRLLAVVCALLYAFLPFHQQRITHIWLELYFMIPLVGLVAIWIVTNQIQFRRDEKSNLLKNILHNKKLLQSLIISFMVSSTGLYYAFFSCCLYAIALLINLLRKEDKKQCLFPVIFIFTTFIGILPNVIPHIIYIIQQGSNSMSELALRSAAESEVYGLKMIQLLLPRQGHRISLFNSIATYYAKVSPITNENFTSSLGIIGSMGFVILMMGVFNYKIKDKYRNGLILLNLGIFLIATIGGVGAIFGYLFNTPMRCYNRLSLFIGFFSILCIASILNELSEKFKKYSFYKYIYYLGSFILLFIGLYDQTTSYNSNSQAQTIVEYNNDNKFVDMIEKTVPENSLIYQLPHICFPSGKTYKPLKGYLNSSNLIWSYASMQGREQDQWEHYLSEISIKKMVENLSYAGYAAIYLDKSLYDSQEEADELVKELSEILKTTPIYSGNNKLLFYNMEGYNKEIKASMNQDVYKKKKEEVYKYLSIQYAGEFSTLESDESENTWRWSGSNGIIKLNNRKSEEIKFEYSTMAQSPTGESVLEIVINGKKAYNYNLNNEKTKIDMDITLKPGENIIEFHSDAPPINSGTDSRELVFILWNTDVEFD